MCMCRVCFTEHTGAAHRAALRAAMPLFARYQICACVVCVLLNTQAQLIVLHSVIKLLGKAGDADGAERVLTALARAGRATSYTWGTAFIAFADAGRFDVALRHLKRACRAGIDIGPVRVEKHTHTHTHTHTRVRARTHTDVPAQIRSLGFGVQGYAGECVCLCVCVCVRRSVRVVCSR